VRCAVGFPSPASDYIEPELDLNELVESSEATYYVRVGDESDVVGIHAGDVLVIDRALPHVHGSVVLAIVGEQFVLRRLRRARGLYVLTADTHHLLSVEVEQEAIWGVVAYVIHKLVPKARKRPALSDDTTGPGGDAR
jgi:DNA polymerase V